MTDWENEQIISANITETESKGSPRVGYYAEQILEA